MAKSLRKVSESFSTSPIPSPELAALWRRALRKIGPDTVVRAYRGDEPLEGDAAKLLYATRRSSKPGGTREDVPDYVTLDQIALIVRKSKRTLENLKAKGMPKPVNKAKRGSGKADEWVWSEIRPWLEKEFNRKLPEKYPHFI
jgi:hypothetical protein